MSSMVWFVGKSSCVSSFAILQNFELAPLVLRLVIFAYFLVLYVYVWLPDLCIICSPKRTRNVFDWGKEEEDLENQTMETFGDNIMGIDTHDFQEATAFLKKSTADKIHGEESSDGLAGFSAPRDNSFEGQ